MSFVHCHFNGLSFTRKLTSLFVQVWKLDTVSCKVDWLVRSCAQNGLQAVLQVILSERHRADRVQLWNHHVQSKLVKELRILYKRVAAESFGTASIESCLKYDFDHVLASFHLHSRRMRPRCRCGALIARRHPEASRKRTSSALVIERAGCHSHPL